MRSELNTYAAMDYTLREAIRFFPKDAIRKYLAIEGWYLFNG